MYSLDINLLKDRQHKKLRGSARSVKWLQPTGDLTRLYLGIGFGLLLPAFAGGAWIALQYQNSRMENQVAELDSQLNRLGIQEQQLQQIQAETNKIKSENQALASVFNQIRPWSAMLQDLRDRTPATVQIQSIKQSTITPPAPPPSSPSSSNANSTNKKQQAPTTPVATSGIEISGMASSFSGVNDFLLTLQQSPFFKPQETKIVSAELVETPTQFSSAGKASPKPPDFVRYTIQSSLSDIPASELINELEHDGTLGLVTRIRTLQEKGIIQK